MNCDLNVYSPISYKPLQDCDYRPLNKKEKKEKKKNKFLQNSPFMLE
jgi:hypothetical protein